MSIERGFLDWLLNNATIQTHLGDRIYRKLPGASDLPAAVLVVDQVDQARHQLGRSDLRTTTFSVVLVAGLSGPLIDASEAIATELDAKTGLTMGAVAVQYARVDSIVERDSRLGDGLDRHRFVRVLTVEIWHENP